MKLTSSLAAIVTGGASGLGEATARMLAAQGVQVAIFDMNDERGAQVASETGALYCPVDVTDEDSVDAGLEKARAAHGTERILVNCAGIVFGRRTVSKDRETGRTKPHDLTSFKKVIDVNLSGTFHMMSKSAAAMAESETLGKDKERGVIINTSSVAGTEGQIGQVAYSASKGGILGMTLPVARDLMDYGIRVVAIQPGIFWTPMFDKIDPDYAKALAENVPFPKRLGTAEEYADLVQFICQNNYVNGSAIRLDGAVRLEPK